MPVYEKKGFEADDVIGTLVRAAQKNTKNNASSRENLKCIIVSGDLDVLQLVDDNTEVYTLKRGISDTIIYTEKSVQEKYGFGPDQVIDYKALRGDLSDNIPGIKGIGEKTASELIVKYKNLDNIYKVIEKLSNKEIKGKEEIKLSVVAKLIKYQKEAYLSKKLATIVRNVDIRFNLDDARVKQFNTEQVIKLFQQWKFNSLIAKIPQAEKVMLQKQGNLFNQQDTKLNQQNSEEFRIKHGYNLVDNEKRFSEFIDKLSKQEQFVFDTETDGLDPFSSRLLGVSFCWKSGEA